MKLKSFLEEDTGLICDKCGSRVDKKDAITVKKMEKKLHFAKSVMRNIRNTKKKKI
jgi:hypothetical protein